MSGGCDEVKASVDSCVGERNAVDSGFGVQELLVPRLDEVDDRVPAL